LPACRVVDHQPIVQDAIAATRPDASA
jgi:hypothetical protein